MKAPTIALDSNALKPLFQHHKLAIYQRVARAELEVYVPVVVYAEQAIYPKEPIDNVVEALNAQVAPFEIAHARRLGRLWQKLPDPFMRQRKRTLWREHRFDWLIAAMALHHNWTLVTQDTGPAFSAPGLSVLTVEQFVAQYLHEKKSIQYTGVKLTCAPSLF